MLPRKVQFNSQSIHHKHYATTQSSIRDPIAEVTTDNPICQSMAVSDFQTLIKSCPIKDFLFSRSVLVAEWVRQLDSNPVMVAVVSSNSTGCNFILLFFKTLGVNTVQKCQICVENEKPDQVTTT